MTDQQTDRTSPTPEVVENLVVEHQGWAVSIARSVARSWNMDWQLDGMDGAALEALLFCAKRYDPARGVPFRSYARRRIHEASTEEARKSKGWQKRTSASPEESRAREVSAELFNVFPELREGNLPSPEDLGSDGDDIRGAIRNVLMSASLIAAKQESELDTPEDLVEVKRLLRTMAQLECVHQFLMWKVYWEGHSLRSVATEWETDELNVVREHKSILSYLYRGASKGRVVERPKVRPGLRDISVKLRKKSAKGPFGSLVQKEG